MHVLLEQRVSLVSLFTGRDVISLLPTGSGKTFAFLGLVVLYNKLFAKRRPEWRPLLIVISPLINLMKEQSLGFNYYASAARLPLVAGHLTSDQKDADVPRSVYSGASCFSVLFLSPEKAKGQYKFLFSRPAYKERNVAIVLDEVHCVIVTFFLIVSYIVLLDICLFLCLFLCFKHWGSKFRATFAELYPLRLLNDRVPWGAYTATLTTDERKDTIRILGLKDPVISEKPCNRKNIFLVVKQFDQQEFLDSLVKELNEQKGDTPRYLIYTKYKGDARLFAQHIANRIGQYSGATGCRRVNHINASLSLEEQSTILADFSRVDSDCRVLFSSIVVGMGTDLRSITRVARIGQSENLGKWAQELGRAGRGGERSIATLYLCSGRRFPTSKEMRPFVSATLCLRMLIVSYYNSDFKLADIDVLGETEADKTFNCCSVCRERQSRSNVTVKASDSEETETDDEEEEKIDREAENSDNEEDINYDTDETHVLSKMHELERNQ
jgi:ATP-dependent DNA helicase RecQ